MKREFLQNLTVDGKPLPKEVMDAIMAENGRDIQAAKQSSTQWEEKYNRAVEDHKKELDELRFGNLLKEAVRAAKGRNEKAIAALLDLETIRTGEDPSAALTEAIAALKKDSSYLFEGEEVPPPYARGTGTRQGGVNEHPATLAGALRQRYETAKRSQ